MAFTPIIPAELGVLEGQLENILRNPRPRHGQLEELEKALERIVTMMKTVGLLRTRFSSASRVRAECHPRERDCEVYNRIKRYWFVLRVLQAIEGAKEHPREYDVGVISNCLRKRFDGVFRAAEDVKEINDDLTDYLEGFYLTPNAGSNVVEILRNMCRFVLTDCRSVSYCLGCGTAIPCKLFPKEGILQDSYVHCDNIPYEMTEQLLDYCDEKNYTVDASIYFY